MRQFAAVVVALSVVAAGCYEPPAQDPVSITLQVQESDHIELDLGTEDAEQEEPMSAPLFIRTPYMLSSHIDCGGTYPLVRETIATHGALETTTLLIESIRWWFPPISSVAGLGAGYVELSILTPSAETIKLERYEVAALAQDVYVDPVHVSLDLLLPPGHSLQMYQTIENIMPGVPYACHVVAQGGELG